MSDKTKIEWTDATWNPIRGCSRVSEGCRNCYAERIAARFSGPGQAYEGLAVMGFPKPRTPASGQRRPRIPGHWTGALQFVPDALDHPLHWHRPRKIFVNSMSDLFHEKTPQPWQIAIFEVMAQCPQHAFQILTKRPAEMLKFMEMTNLRVPEEIARGIHVWPLPNVWLGVSVEDQKTADERIPLLLQTPAAVRWVSYEPALGPVDFTYGLSQCHNFTPYKGDYGAALVTRGIDWMVAGGESGPGARPSHPYWFRTVRDQCLRAVVPFFFKQWGEWIPVSQHVQTGDARLHRGTFRDGVHFIRLGKKYAGHLLDGREWREFPISHQSPVTSHGVQK